MKAATTNARNTGAEFKPIFDALKAILHPCLGNLVVASDTASFFSIETKTPTCRRKPLMFGAVRLCKAYVSFHLMPVYMDRDLLKAISAELKKHMQGQACFNFKTVDESLFAELRELTTAGMHRWKALQLL